MSLDKDVYVTEGPDMKEEMMDQLRDWYIKYREREGTFPDFPPEEEEEPTAEELAKAEAEKGEGRQGEGREEGPEEGRQEGQGRRGRRAAAAAAGALYEPAEGLVPGVVGQVAAPRRGLQLCAEARRGAGEADGAARRRAQGAR